MLCLKRTFVFLLAASFMFAVAGTALAADSEIPANVELLKKFRAAENEQTMLEHARANALQSDPDAQQAAQLRWLDAQQARENQFTPEFGNRNDVRFRAMEQSGIFQTDRDLRDVVYNSGVIYINRPDSLYFNFFLGTNGNDTLGMDVMGSGNEGINFGSESRWIDGTQYPAFDDPSMLYYYSVAGSLDTVTVVPSVDDPDEVWTHISWDWDGGNNGQPIAPGNLWVVHTRTSDMYVVLQVTDTGADWFMFDYMIQTNGTPIFDGEPPVVELTVNGMDADTVDIGSNPYFEAYLGDLGGCGEILVFWDADHNGIANEGDVLLEVYEFCDNDIHDEDFDIGYFGFTYSDEMADGLNYVTDDFTFMVTTELGFASVGVTFEEIDYPYSVSGTVTDLDTGDPLGGIIVWIGYAWDGEDDPPREDDGPIVIDVTDDFGDYLLMVPDSFLYHVGTFDHLGQTDGLVPDIGMQEVYVDGSIEGIDFQYRVPETTISGTVSDELGNPVADVGVDVDGEMFELTVYTDIDGYYEVGVDFGEYELEIEPESIMPDYMVPPWSEYILAGDFVANIVDFMLLSTNATISGTVYLDDTPFPGVFVMAWDEDIGFNGVQTDVDGTYEVPVHAPMIEAYYSMHVHLEDMEGIVQVSDNYDVMPGATGEDIYLVTVTGGLFGTFYNAETEEPLLWEDRIGMSARSLEFGREEYSTGPDPETGEYELYLPPGIYEVTAGGEYWMGPPPDTVLVGEEMMPYDIYLSPFFADAVLEGQVLANLPREGIADAHVEIGNEYWGDYQMTDGEGYFHFDLPHGDYGIHVWADGYFDWWGNVSVWSNYEFIQIWLDPIQIDGSIYGTVLDEATGAAIEGVNLWFWNDWGPSFNAMTEMDGSYSVGVPNGDYYVGAHHPDYIEYFDMEPIMVEDNDVNYSFNMILADGSISGFVHNMDNGDPVDNAGIMLVDQNNPDFFLGGGTDHEGHYHVNLLNGSYDLYVDAYGYAPYWYGPIVIENDHVIWDVPMQPMPQMWPPMINFVMDQPNDQGRWVRTQFQTGGTQWGPYEGWSVWRMTMLEMGELWDYVTYVAFQGQDMYNLTVPTLVDSSAYSGPNFWTTLVVTGHDGPWNWIDSDPMAGYSIDNIHPGVPAGLMIQDTGEDFVALGWEPSIDADFQHFLLFVSTTPDFGGVEPIPLLESHFTDANVEVGSTYYYMVMAVDANGNLSDPSDVVSTTIVSIDEARGIPTSFVLDQNYPNPFNPSTQITFGLPATSHVVLEIYNVLGKRVRTLVSETLPAGYITTSWDGMDQNGDQVASGTYVYRMRTPTESYSKKMLLMR